MADPDIEIQRPAGHANEIIHTGTDNLGSQPYGTPIVLTYTIANVGIEIDSFAFPDVDEGTIVDETMTAQGGIGAQTWALTAGALPDGLTLETDGQIHGTTSAPGTFTWTLEVTDSEGRTDTQTFAMTVNAVGLPGTPTFIFDIEEQTDLTGSSYNSLQDSSGNGFHLTFSAGTKAVKDAGAQLDGIDTLDTNNTYGDYISAVGVDLAGDFFPNSGVGTVMLVFRPDSHPDFFSSPDYILTSTTSTDWEMSIIDGPLFRGKSNTRTADYATNLSYGTWYVSTTRFNATNIRTQIDNGTEVTTTNDARTTNTGRLTAFGEAGSGGRYDGHIAFMVLWPDVLSDEDVTAAKDYLKGRFPSLNV